MIREAEIEPRYADVQEAGVRGDRARMLFAEGLVARSATEVNLFPSDLDAEQRLAEKFEPEIQSVRNWIGTPEERRDLLRRKLARFELVAPRPGMIFGEDLPRPEGPHFQKGRRGGRHQPCCCSAFLPCPSANSFR